MSDLAENLVPSFSKDQIDQTTSAPRDPVSQCIWAFANSQICDCSKEAMQTNPYNSRQQIRRFSDTVHKGSQKIEGLCVCALFSLECRIEDCVVAQKSCVSDWKVHGSLVKQQRTLLQFCKRLWMLLAWLNSFVVEINIMLPTTSAPIKFYWAILLQVHAQWSWYNEREIFSPTSIRNVSFRFTAAWTGLPIIALWARQQFLGSSFLSHLDVGVFTEWKDTIFQQNTSSSTFAQPLPHPLVNSKKSSGLMVCSLMEIQAPESHILVQLAGSWHNKFQRLYSCTGVLVFGQKMMQRKNTPRKCQIRSRKQNLKFVTFESPDINVWHVARGRVTGRETAAWLAALLSFMAKIRIVLMRYGSLPFQTARGELCLRMWRPAAHSISFKGVSTSISAAH